MILAGDVGATKTLIGLFEPGSADGATRPAPTRIERYATADFDGLPSMIRAYLDTIPHPRAIDAACFGVAGPVLDRQARLTNVTWHVSADEVARTFDIAHVRLLNDLEAMAYAVPVLRSDELHTLQRGEPDAASHAVLIAAGTGLGEAILHRVDGRLRPLATEGGHTDFAARTDRELELVRVLRTTRGRAELEAVVSGIGLINVARFTHGATACNVAGALEAEDSTSAARVSAAAMDGSCPHCVETLDIFLAAYGAAAGNLALQAVAGAGVYVGGGIAPRILPLMTNGTFLDAFRAKPPMDEFLARVPVHVVLNAESGILGAAVAAADRSQTA